MLVAGFSGIGKTAVINEVHKPLARTKGYFIKGKFDQFNCNIPLSALVRAFRDLIGQLMAESDSQLQCWKTAILETVGESGQVLIQLLPELEGIIGPQPPIPELSGTAAQNRLNLLFQKFVALFARSEHPLVLFLDDLQWADSASLQLIKQLAQNQRYFLLLGAYRDNEVSRAHPFMLAVEELKAEGTPVETLTLNPLGFSDTNQFVADTLKRSPEQARPLAELLNRQAKGNPFFLTQLLEVLHADGAITFDRAGGFWTWDMARANLRATTEDVAEFIAAQLQKLPRETQELLKLAACIGNPFDLETLTAISDCSQTQVAKALWAALQEGAIVPQTQVYKFFLSSETAANSLHSPGNVYYRFLHDRVQQAAYSLISEVDKVATHHCIGERLLSKLSPEELQERIFEVVNQLNYGAELMTQQAPERVEELARFNLIACRKARATTAYQAGFQYAQTGLGLLGTEGWQQQYQMTLELHELAVELAMLCGDFEEMERYAEIAIQQARTLLDAIEVYRLKIQALKSQLRFSEGLNAALSVLGRLGVTLPETPTPQEMQQAILGVDELLAGREIATLADLPIATNPEKIAILQIASSAITSAVNSGSPLSPLLIALAVRTSIQFGNTLASITSYGAYGLILCNFFKDIEKGTQFARVAFALAEKFNNKAVKPEVLVILAGSTLHRTTHVRNTLPIAREAHAIALEVGNFEYAGYAASTLCMNTFWCGAPLGGLELEVRAHHKECLHLKQSTAVHLCQILGQMVLNLQGLTATPTRLSGEMLQEEEFLPYLLATHEYIGLYGFSVIKLFLNYWFGEIDEAERYAIELKRYAIADSETFTKPTVYFYDSLSALASLSWYPERRDELLDRVTANQTEIERDWLSYAPMNYQHRFDLVEAEKCRILGQNVRALELYDKAISGARANEFTQEEALANELAAKLCLEWGKEKVAASYMQDAYYTYARWGAKAKTDDLERRYPNLLAPILRSATPSLNPLETLASLSATDISLHSLTAASSGSSSSFNTTLDLTAILKASQSVSGTLNLEELLAQLSRIILQHSGADRCVLILPDAGDTWQVQAQATTLTTLIDTEPLEGNSQLPTNLIYYVKNTRETLSLDNLQKKLPSSDLYFFAHQPKSILVLPILNQGKLMGVLYLENQQTAGAFTPERQLILNFLCTQAAISLENARLYRQAQDYAQQLEQSQLQIVQSEKMASLGNLVAGVAHEINNPIGFLNGSVENLKEYLRDLFGYVELYQTTFPDAPDDLLDYAEDIDFEFLEEDCPKVLVSMQGAIERIKGISNSLRTFSRADSDRKVSANLHEGLDSTLLILKYRLKANESRPAIEIIKDYGDLPEIECFPGQLNQVFMNILANAIDALDESAQQYSYQELEAHPQHIELKTEYNPDHRTASVKIRDNGPGIPKELRSKVFAHLFTTKAVGKGTGLGLAIAWQIIVDKHGGKLEVRSELGEGTEFSIELPLGG